MSAVGAEGAVLTNPIGAAVPRRLRSEAHAGELILSALVAAMGGALLFAVTPLSGGLGAFLVAAVLFVGFAGSVAWRRRGRSAAADRVATLLAAGAAAAVVVPLALIVGYVAVRALPHLRGGFFTHTLEGVDPDAPATAGGAAHAIVGTLMQVLLATLISLPFGVLTAVYLNEIGGRMRGAVRVIVDAMSGIPSVVAGLFVYSMWVVRFGRGYSGLAAALALSVLMLPTIARTTEEMLRLVPSGLRESALALGAPEWRTALQVVVPTARTGIVTAVILGIARVAGETAPLLMTAFGNDRVTFAVGSPQSALPLFVFQQVTNAQGAAVDRAWVGAFVLVALVLVLFVLARLIGRSDSGAHRR